MAWPWRELLPHFLGMFVIYFSIVVAVDLLFGVQDFWISLVIALGIAFLYPSLTRRLGVEPEPWSREE